MELPLSRALESVTGVAAHENGRSFSLLFEATFGIVLQRARFCFFYMFREWFDGRAPQGVLGLIVALAVGLIGTTLVFGTSLRDAGTLHRRACKASTVFRGCIAVVRGALLSPNSAFVLGLVAASLAAALVAGQFKLQHPRIDHVLRGLTGGVLLGWGAMTGLGCTVGTLFSGITAGALSSWLFGASLFTGTAVTLWSGRRLGLLPRG